MSYPKGRIVKRCIERKRKNGVLIPNKAVFNNKSDQRKSSVHAGYRNFVDANRFLDKLPHKDDTAFGYTTLIDPGCRLKDMVCGSEETKNVIGDLNKAEMEAIDYLIDGQHYAHLGVYGLFDFSDDKTFPCLLYTSDAADE